MHSWNLRDTQISSNKSEDVYSATMERSQRTTSGASSNETTKYNPFEVEET